MGTFFRNLGAAALGFVVMAVTVVVLMLVVGLVFAFMSEWVGFALSIVVNLVAAAIGGMVCAKVAADARGVWTLIVAVFVFGVAVVLVPDAVDSDPEPLWLSWLNPLLGAVGVYFGAGRVKGG